MKNYIKNTTAKLAKTQAQTLFFESGLVHLLKNFIKDIKDKSDINRNRTKTKKRSNEKRVKKKVKIILIKKDQLIKKMLKTQRAQIQGLQKQRKYFEDNKLIGIKVGTA